MDSCGQLAREAGAVVDWYVPYDDAITEWASLDTRGMRADLLRRRANIKPLEHKLLTYAHQLQRDGRLELRNELMRALREWRTRGRPDNDAALGADIAGVRRKDMRRMYARPHGRGAESESAGAAAFKREWRRIK